MEPGDSDSLSTAVIIADIRTVLAGVGLKPLPGWGGAGAAQGQSRTVGGIDTRVRARQRGQNADCSDSEGENALSDIGVAAISTVGQSPHHPGSSDGGCVPTEGHRQIPECHRRLWVSSPWHTLTLISWLPLGVHLGQTSVVTSHSMGTATAQSTPLPALPKGCHPPAGQALPGWDPCVLRACSAALGPGAGTGGVQQPPVQHPWTRDGGRN